MKTELKPWKACWSVDGDQFAVYPDTGKMEFPIAVKPQYVRADVWEAHARLIVEAVNAFRPASQPDSYIVANGGGTQWRTWQSGMPEWTSDRSQATRYCRRADAEAVHMNDEDAWRIEAYASQPAETPMRERQRLGQEFDASQPADAVGVDGKNGTAPANPMGQPPAPYGKVHTDGSRSGGMPPGTNARPPAPQDDLVEELPQPLKDLLHHIVQCMVAEGCGEISAWESIKTIWPAITDYFAPIIAERDAALANLAAAEAALQDQLVRHEERAKGLSKQPPAPDRDWRLMEHRDQMNELRAALTTEKNDEK